MDHNAAVGNLKHKQVLNENEEEKKQRFDSQRDQILQQVLILKSSASSSLSNRAAVVTALNVLSELARDGELVDTIVNSDIVPVILRLMFYLKDENGSEGDEVTYDLQRGCALVLGLLARKQEHRQLIVDAGALPYLVEFLRMHKAGHMSQALIGLLHATEDAISYLALANTNIANLVRNQGGIPPLVELLEFNDPMVQRAAVGALNALSFENDDTINQIVECNALPTLVSRMQSVDPTTHYEAVNLIRNMVHTSPDIRGVVLEAGALQPVIFLLRSSSLNTQRLAAYLLGELSETDSYSKARIAQRGAIGPLVDILKSSDEMLCALSALVLARLSQNADNKAGIAYNGGIEPLLNLLGSNNGFVQRSAAFTLSCVADDEDSVAYIIQAGGLQILLNGQFCTPSKACAEKTLERLAEHMHGRVLKHLLSLMRFGDEGVQRLVAIALAHLCSPDDCKTIFIVNNGLELLLDLFESPNLEQKSDASAALHKLAIKAISVSLVDVGAPSPTSQVYMGEQYVNNPELSDVTFLVEGKRFYAHRVCLQASSDIFRAMFDGGYKESETKEIEIPNIKWEVFELMMRFIYTGTVDVELDIAEDLLQAADQYFLEGLKRLCENTISQDISVDNVSLMFDMSETFNATSLRNSCILFVLEQFDKLSVKPWFGSLVDCIAPDVRKFFSALLTKLA